MSTLTQYADATMSLSTVAKGAWKSIKRIRRFVSLTVLHSPWSTPVLSRFRDGTDPAKRGHKPGPARRSGSQS